MAAQTTCKIVKPTWRRIVIKSWIVIFKKMYRILYFFHIAPLLHYKLNCQTTPPPKKNIKENREASAWASLKPVELNWRAVRNLLKRSSSVSSPSHNRVCTNNSSDCLTLSLVTKQNLVSWSGFRSFLLYSLCAVAVGYGEDNLNISTWVSL